MNIEEKWKDINGWEELYMISNLGRVYSKRYHKIKAVNINNNGYPKVDLFRRIGKEIKRKTVYIHRLVAEHFVEGQRDGLVVDHIDGDKTNCIVTNLRWVTQSENIKKGYTENIGSNKKRFKKVPVFIEGQPRLYFSSIRECAKSLGIPENKIKLAMRFYDGKIPSLNVQVKRCDRNDQP